MISDADTLAIPALEIPDDLAFGSRPTRQLASTIRRLPTRIEPGPSEAVMYVVDHGPHRYQVWARSVDDVRMIAGERQVLHPELAEYWPPRIEEVVR